MKPMTKEEKSLKEGLENPLRSRITVFGCLVLLFGRSS
jgi:hypothetical protein